MKKIKSSKKNYLCTLLFISISFLNSISFAHDYYHGCIEKQYNPSVNEINNCQYITNEFNLGCINALWHGGGSAQILACSAINNPYALDCLLSNKRKRLSIIDACTDVKTKQQSDIIRDLGSFATSSQIKAVIAGSSSTPKPVGGKNKAKPLPKEKWNNRVFTNVGNGPCVDPGSISVGGEISTLPICEQGHRAMVKNDDRAEFSLTCFDNSELLVNIDLSKDKKINDAKIVEAFLKDEDMAIDIQVDGKDKKHLLNSDWEFDQKTKNLYTILEGGKLIDELASLTEGPGLLYALSSGLRSEVSINLEGSHFLKHLKFSLIGSRKSIIELIESCEMD